MYAGEGSYAGISSFSWSEISVSSLLSAWGVEIEASESPEMTRRLTMRNFWPSQSRYWLVPSYPRKRHLNSLGAIFPRSLLVIVCIAHQTERMHGGEVGFGLVECFVGVISSTLVGDLLMISIVVLKASAHGVAGSPAAIN